MPVGGPEGVGEGAADLLALPESGRLDGSKDLYDRGNAVPRWRFVAGPSYRCPRKLRGIGLTYVEHAGDARPGTTGGNGGRLPGRLPYEALKPAK